MKFGDYAPPAVPTLDQQRDALQKGLGRAMQWALAGWCAVRFASVGALNAALGPPTQMGVFDRMTQVH